MKISDRVKQYGVGWKEATPTQKVGIYFAYQYLRVRRWLHRRKLLQVTLADAQLVIFIAFIMGLFLGFLGSRMV